MSKIAAVDGNRMNAHRERRETPSPFHRRVRLLVALVTIACARQHAADIAAAEEISAAAVNQSIERGIEFLTQKQDRDGHWAAATDIDQHNVGVTALVTLALINCGMKTDHPVLQRSLKYIRAATPADLAKTYDLSLAIMALTAVRDGRNADQILLERMVNQLASSQVGGGNIGGWTYGSSGQSGGVATPAMPSSRCWRSTKQPKPGSRSIARCGKMHAPTGCRSKAPMAGGRTK